MNTNRFSQKLNIIVLAAMLFVSAFAAPLAPVHAAGNVSATVTNDSTAQVVVVNVSADGEYRVNREGNNPNEVLTVVASNGVLRFDLGGKKAWQVQGGIVPSDQSSVWKKITDDGWFGLDSTAPATTATNPVTTTVNGGGFLLNPAGETVNQTGEGALTGPAKGTFIQDALDGEYATMIDEIDAAIAAGCPTESGICYRWVKDGSGVVFTGSTDFVNHVIQEGDVLEFLRNNGIVYFRNDNVVFLEAVRFQLTNLDTDTTRSYSVDTRVQLDPGHYEFVQKDNKYNPGFRAAHENQLPWLNSDANQPFEAVLYVHFDGRPMDREGNFVETGSANSNNPAATETPDAATGKVSGGVVVNPTPMPAESDLLVAIPRETTVDTVEFAQAVGGVFCWGIVIALAIAGLVWFLRRRK